MKTKNRSQGNNNVSRALMEKWGNKRGTFTLRSDKSDAPNHITGNAITLQCFKGHFDRESLEIMKENEHKVPDFVRP